jgi:1-phosphofructokinase family hexose kinase
MHVLCVTPNIALDRTLTVPRLVAGRVHRAERVTALCGGKGVNVARAVYRLGHFATCAGILAGASGRIAADRAESEGLEAVWTWVDGETRTCIIIVGEDGETTVVNEPGPEVSRAGWTRFQMDVARAARAADTVCISGSLPPGCPPDGMVGLITAVAGDGRPVWVDSGGEALAEAVEAGVDGVKVNAAEVSAVLGRSVVTAAGAASAALELRRRGVGTVAITLGGDGAVVATGQGLWRSRPPAVRVVNDAGCGDTFLAGLVIGLSEGEPAQEALRRGTAAGTANVCSERAGEVDADEFERILRATVVEPVRL